jgi:murein hydrolase activator
MRFLFIFLACMLHIVSPVLAQEATPKDIKKIEQKIADEKDQQKSLGLKVETYQQDLKKIKKDLVAQASQVKATEGKAQNLEQKIAELEAEKIKIETLLAEDRENLSRLIMALERIQRLPPETLIARPDAPLETAQAATILSSIMPKLQIRANDLKQKVQELTALRKDLEGNKMALAQTADKLKLKQQDLDKLIEEREKILRQTQKDFAQKEKNIASLSKEAKNLKDLISKIEERNRKIREEARRKKEEKNRLAQKSKSEKTSGEKTTKAKRDRDDEEDLQASLPALGAAQLPVSGIVRIGYGEEDEIGAKSEGLRIEGRQGALVVAPLGGVIRYAGEFKSYGRMILLEHKNNYMSLIAGLGKIDTVVGQSVDSGEPLGVLSPSSGKPVLYYELRYKGSPINPARKIKNIRS